MSIYYVYAYIHPVTNVPFYVGYGKNNRMFSHLNEAKKPKLKCTSHKTNTIKKILSQGLVPIIKVIDSNLSKETACELEIFLISILGRRDLETGSLTNLTSGGEGVQNLSQSTRNIMSDKKKPLVSVKDKDGNMFLVHNTDHRWLSGELVGINKNRDFGDEFRELKRIQCTGSGNPMFGKKQPKLSAGNKDPILIEKRKSSFLASRKVIYDIKLNKIILALNYDSYEECKTSLSYLSELFFNFGCFAYKRNIINSLFIDSGFMLSKPELSMLLKEFDISSPKHNKIDRI